ncbi:hypothetical protein WJX77_011707 [Trebouxia sp. C0004]
MAGSDSDDLEDMLLEAGGAGKPSNKRSRDEDVSDASQQDGDSQLSEEVSQEYQAPARKAKASGKKRKTATGSDAADKDDTFDEDAFVFDGYGKDLIRGSADQAELDKLTEFERENELFQRAEARDREIERRRHAKLLQQSRAQQATAHPQTAADKADQMRSSTRQKKPDTGKKDAMAELRARRAQAQERKTTQEVAKKRGRKGGGQDSDEAYTDDEAISESDSDDDRLPAVSAQEASADDLSSGPSPLRDSSEERDVRRDSDRHDKGKALTPDVDKDDEDVPANDAELESLQVKRHTLERWVNEPFFLTTVTGCLVKVAYSGKYHLAEIVDVQEREPGKHRDMGVNVTYPYQFGSGTTRKVLLIRRGNSDRVCPMYVVSNKTLDAQDLCSLTAYNEDQRMPQITRSHTNRKKEELMKAHNYTYTAADVKQMLAEKKARGSSRVNIAAEKARLTRERDHAQEVGDINEIERTEAELSHLEHRQANSERHANKQAFGMSNVNQRNKHTNFMNAYKNVSSAPDNQKVSATGADAFSRRKTQSKVYWSTIPKNKRDELEAAAAAAGTTVCVNADGTATVQAGATGNMNLAGLEVPAAAVRTNADGDVINLEIDISVLDSIPEGAITARKLLGPQYGFVPSRHAVPADLNMKKLLTLSEYKRRHATGS